MTQLETMYTQVVGKPSTTTSREFRIGDATLYVASTTLFPAAPNKVTITDASETNLVTLWYTAKTATTLTVSTVVECYPPTATAAVFAIGSTAHRPFCKSDVDALSGNITQLNANKAELTHATTHTLNGSDPITIHPSQVVGNGATLDVSVIPKVALDKAVTVANDAARFALTTATVQTGDSVKVAATQKLYFVTDDTKLNQEAGYLEYTAKPVTHGATHLTNGEDPVPKATTSADGLMPKEALAKTNLVSHFGTCTTAAGTAAKTVTLTGFTLVDGARIILKFGVSNAAAAPTLNVNNTGAKPITWMGERISPDIIKAGAVYEMVYDGTNYCIVGDITRHKSPEVHGYIIDENNSVPSQRVTLIGASANTTGEEREEIYRKYVRHCVFKGAVTQYYVDEDDWSKKEDGTPSGVENGKALDGNFGLEHKHFWTRRTTYGNKILMREFTWEDPHDDSWVPCHIYKDGTIRDHGYLGAFEGVGDANYHGENCLRSVYGTTNEYVPLVGLNTEDMYNRAKNTGEAEGLTGDDNTYSTVPPLIKLMRCILLIWRYGTTDLQAAVGRGIVDDTSSTVGKRPVGYGVSLTGGNAQGNTAAVQTYQDNTGVVSAGAANEWGNVFEQTCDMAYDGWDEVVYATRGGDHLNIVPLTAANWDASIPPTYVRMHGVCKDNGTRYTTSTICDKNGLALPATTVTASNVHYADRFYRNSADTEENHVPRCCLVGGSWYYAGNAGPFYLALNNAATASHSSFGARLHAYSLT